MEILDAMSYLNQGTYGARRLSAPNFEESASRCENIPCLLCSKFKAKKVNITNKSGVPGIVMVLGVKPFVLVPSHENLFLFFRQN